jgi:hypothetical protein
VPEADAVLDTIVEEVMELMFFSTVLGPAGARPEGPCITATVQFSGPRTGTLGVCSPQAAVTALAANFLQLEEEDSEKEVDSIFGELANVLCGALLGRMEPAGHFAISVPQVSRSLEGGGLPENTPVRRCVEIEEGALEIGLAIV